EAYSSHLYEPHVLVGASVYTIQYIFLNMLDHHQGEVPEQAFGKNEKADNNWLTGNHVFFPLVDNFGEITEKKMLHVLFPFSFFSLTPFFLLELNHLLLHLLQAEHPLHVK